MNSNWPTIDGNRCVIVQRNQLKFIAINGKFKWNYLRVQVKSRQQPLSKNSNLKFVQVAECVCVCVWHFEQTANEVSGRLEFGFWRSVWFFRSAYPMPVQTVNKRRHMQFVVRMAVCASSTLRHVRVLVYASVFQRLHFARRLYLALFLLGACVCVCYLWHCFEWNCFLLRTRSLVVWTNTERRCKCKNVSVRVAFVYCLFCVALRNANAL